MTAPDILTHLGRSGHLVAYSAADGMVVTPQPSAKVIARLRAQQPALTAYLAALSAPPATGHAFVVTSTALALGYAPDYFVCIACGVPWALHGEPPAASWAAVNDPQAVELLEAAAIWGEVAA